MNTLVVLPDGLYPARSLMGLMVQKEIFNIVFYEDPKWFINDHRKLVFLRAAMQNLYDDYYDVFHDEKTRFHYIERNDVFDMNKILTGKVYAFNSLGSLENLKATILNKRKHLKPRYTGRVVPTVMPVVVSDKSKISWLAADTYVTEVLKVPGDLPTIQPTWFYDIQKTMKKYVKIIDAGDLPHYLKWLIEHRLVTIRSENPSAAEDYQNSF